MNKINIVFLSSILLCGTSFAQIHQPSKVTDTDVPNTDTPNIESPRSILILPGVKVIQSTTDLSFKELLGFAESGDAASQVKLGDIYYNGNLTGSRDYTTAQHWYKEATKNGNGIAAYKIALMTLEGAVEKPSDTEANKWFTVSLRMGNYKAADALGDSFMLGRGVPVDMTRAIELYKIAAADGVIESQIKLSGIYNKGVGAPANPSQAYYWLSIADSNPSHELYPAVKQNMSLFEKPLSMDQINEIKQQVINFNNQTAEKSDLKK